MQDFESDAGGTAPPALAAQATATRAPPVSSNDNSAFMAGLREIYDQHLKNHVESGLLLTKREFSLALAVNNTEIDTAVMDGRFIAVTTASGEIFYPRFFTQPSIFPADALTDVLKAMGKISDGEKYHFLTWPSHYLDGQSPLYALATGRLSAVLIAARASAAS